MVQAGLRARRRRRDGGPVVGYWARVGAWRSLVARTVRVGEVPGSNPGAPIAFKSRECPRMQAKGPETLGFAGDGSLVFAVVRWAGWPQSGRSERFAADLAAAKVARLAD
jgi:hypothetical protein